MSGNNDVWRMYQILLNNAIVLINRSICQNVISSCEFILRVLAEEVNLHSYPFSSPFSSFYYKKNIMVPGIYQ